VEILVGMHAGGGTCMPVYTYYYFTTIR
jgi:hypothetical protein